MALKFVILTMLNQERQTGYEIVRSFDSAVGYFWNAKHQQVYRELSNLTDKGLVEFQGVKQGDKPDKKVYGITKQGKHDLQVWMESPLPETPTKDLMLVKLQNITQQNAHLFIAELDLALTRAKERNEIYLSIEKTYYAPEIVKQLSVTELALYIALRKGIIGSNANLTWLKEAKEKIVACLK